MLLRVSRQKPFIVVQPRVSACDLSSDEDCEPSREFIQRPYYHHTLSFPPHSKRRVILSMLNDGFLLWQYSANDLSNVAGFWREVNVHLTLMENKHLRTSCWIANFQRFDRNQQLWSLLLWKSQSLVSEWSLQASRVFTVIKVRNHLLLNYLFGPKSFFSAVTLSILLQTSFKFRHTDFWRLSQPGSCDNLHNQHVSCRAMTENSPQTGRKIQPNHPQVQVDTREGSSESSWAAELITTVTLTLGLDGIPSGTAAAPTV